MSIVDEIPPIRSPDLIFSAADHDGRFVVKSKRHEKYLRIGRQEYFLLEQLNGTNTYGKISQDYLEQFHETISCDDIREFVGLAQKEGLLGKNVKRSSQSKFGLLRIFHRIRRAINSQSILFFRIKVFDPDKLLNYLEPKTRFLFSPFCAILAMFGIVWATIISWTCRDELVHAVTTQFGIQAVVTLWVAMIGVTAFHEFGHGLACKRYGGEVHEMGALWIFFTPCFYCNVSDAWMMPERWKRLVISLAGTYFDLLVWIFAVLTWRLVDSNTTVYFVCWILISSCGVRIFFNLNPLMRLDGYYALSDFLRQPNLRSRARARMMEFVRSILWGATWPKPMPHGKVLLTYAFSSWLFSIGFIGLLSFKLSTWLNQFLGVFGVITAVSFFVLVTKRFFKGSLGGEFQLMFRKRIFRVIIFIALLVGAMFIPVDDRAGGEFVVKPVVHWEVRAPIAGFLREINTMEGQSVTAGSIVSILEVPELTNQISRKLAEIVEVKANLRRLKTGGRPEDIFEQEERIRRAIVWRDLGISNLTLARGALKQELTTLEFQIEQAKIDLEYRKKTYDQSKTLFDKGGLAEQQLFSQKKLVDDAVSALQIAESVKKTREVSGVVDSEIELAKREKELADEKAKLSLLIAGSRIEDVEAEEARLLRLEEEMRIFREQEMKQKISCPVSGTVVTARLQDKIGQFVERGAVIFAIEDLDQLEAEISIPEQNVESIVIGQPIMLKPRLLPSVTLNGTVLRIAPAVQNAPLARTTTVTVYCRFDNKDGLLRAGMTGYGRIHFGNTNVGRWLYDRYIRLLRTEFWW